MLRTAPIRAYIPVSNISRARKFYEETVGRVTAWLRGPVRTPEDEFALKVADEYALFLRQTPWYRFPFGAKLKAFWAETPLVGGNLVRKIERRGSLSLEYAVKAVYAKALGARRARSRAAQDPQRGLWAR